MSVLCVVASWLDREAVESAARVLLDVVPRVAVEWDDVGERRGRVWGDVRGLPAKRVAASALELLEGSGVEGVRCGVGGTPIAAFALAVGAAALAIDESGDVAAEGREGGEEEWLATLSLSVLEPPEALRELLEGVGIETCGALAAVPREAVEVRFGGEAVPLWRRARGEDERRLFAPVPPELPHASMDFVDYVVSDPEQLVFTSHALLGSICAALAERGLHARRLLLELPLADGTTWRRILRPARPTASRAAWLRLVRAVLERLTVPDAVAGVAVRVEAVEPAAAVQGDLFDVGFATAGAVEAAVARLIETQGAVMVRPESTAHPLVEERMRFIPALAVWGAPPPGVCATARNRDRAGPVEMAAPDVSIAAGARTSPASPSEIAARAGAHGEESFAPGLTLQLLPDPRPILVETVRRRDHEVPVRYRDGQWRQLVTVAGPDRVSGGQWERPYAREYFRGVTGDGRLIWLFREARSDDWYLHGWWD